jgi:hypothetical protein
MYSYKCENMNLKRRSNIPWRLAILSSLSLILIEYFSPSFAYSETIFDYYRICLIGGESRACGVLGELCGRGNNRACGLLGDVTSRGYDRIQGFCAARSVIACRFIRDIDRVGLTNLGSACGRGNGSACQKLDTIRCYATEGATRRPCRRFRIF